MRKPGFQMTGTTRDLDPATGKPIPRIERYRVGYRDPNSHRVVWGKSRTVEVHTAKAECLGEKGVSLVVGESGAARWTGLHTCGSVWTCPWCAPRVGDHRREQLVGALTRWRDVGADGRARRGVGLITLTAPHTVHDALVDLRRALTSAMRRVTGHSRYRQLRAELGCAGTIRATEVTYTRNGWHQHFHTVWLQESPMTAEDAAYVKRVLYPLWRAACVAEGLGAPSEEHGVDVGCGSHPDEYVSKFGDVDELCPSRAPRWGVAEELTLGAVKVGRGAESVNPWGLLLAAGAGDELAARLWSEYAAATKGQAQLVWSKGLKGRLGVEDASDEELAARETERDQVVVTVPVRGDEFRAIVRHGLRIRLLEVAETAYAAGEDPQVAVMVVLGQMRDYESRGDGRVDATRTVGGAPWSSS